MDKVKIILQKSAIEEVKRWTGHPDDIINMSERELPRVKFVRSHAIAARHIYWTLDTSLGIARNRLPRPLQIYPVVALNRVHNLPQRTRFSMQSLDV